MSENVLITGVGGPAGRSAVQYFRAKGFRVIGTDIRDVGADVDSFQKVCPADSPGFSSELISLIRKLRPDLLVPTVTEELVNVSRMKGEIEAAGCKVYISNPRAVEVANDKLRTAVVMEFNGIAVPYTFDDETPGEQVVRELGLPLIVKPVFGRGGRGVKLLKTAEDVGAAKGGRIIFQEFIPGPEYDVNLFVGRDGGVDAAVVLLKTELKDGVIGNATSVERADDDAVLSLAIEAARLLKMEGPLDFDVRLKEDGTPVLLEINARLGGNCLFAVEVLDSIFAAYIGSHARAR